MTAPAAAPSATDPGTAPDPAGGGLAETATRLRLAVGRLNRQLARSNPGGLTASQLSVLVRAEQHGPLAVGELATRESVAAPTMTRLVAALEAAGHLARTADPGDRRSWRVSVTPGGVELLTRIRQERSAALAGQLSALSTDQVERLRGALPVLEALVTADCAGSPPAGSTPRDWSPR